MELLIGLMGLLGLLLLLSFTVALFKVAIGLVLIPIKIGFFAVKLAVGLVVFIERGDFPPAGRKVTAISRPRLQPNGDYDFDDVAI